MREDDITTAIDQASETESVEYKISFDVQSSAERLEIIKDVVALANSGGGAIIFGVADSGHVEGVAENLFASLDPADVTNKMCRLPPRRYGVTLEESRPRSVVTIPLNGEAVIHERWQMVHLTR